MRIIDDSFPLVYSYVRALGLCGYDKICTRPDPIRLDRCIPFVLIVLLYAK